MTYRDPADREEPAPVPRAPLLDHSDKKLLFWVCWWCFVSWGLLVLLIATVVVGNVAFRAVDRGREHVIQALPKVRN